MRTNTFGGEGRLRAVCVALAAIFLVLQSQSIVMRVGTQEGLRHAPLLRVSSAFEEVTSRSAPSFSSSPALRLSKTVGSVAETRVGAATELGPVLVRLRPSIVAGHVGRMCPRFDGSVVGSCVATNNGGKIPWNSYADYPKVTIGGREYANVGGRPYTQHAVDRLQPMGLGAPAGASGPGRSISPTYVEDVLTSGQTVRKPVTGPKGEARTSHVSGSVEVITEGNIVITVITR